MTSSASLLLQADCVQETTAAYHDIKTRACDKCNKLVNTKLQLPLIRQLKSATSDGKFEFLALHPDCA